MRILFLLLALCLPSFADDDFTRITVKVTDEKGKPVDRANVRLVFKQGRRKLTMKKIQRSWELKTSQEGTAKLPGIPKGDILIQVTAKNHQSFGDTFTIEEDQRTVEILLKSPQAPFSVHGPNDPRAKQ
jgi:nitrogen fixation protein FixH